MKKKILNLILFLFCATALGLAVRGDVGNPNKENLNNTEWRDGGPFELSPERGRFALLYSVIEDKSFQFDTPIARFATPDLALLNGKYVSLFAPGVSLALIPGYLLGKYFGLSQVGTFLEIALIGLLNVFLIRTIARRLGANELSAVIGGLIFLFATPSFAYSVTLYQHQMSTFLVLASFLLLLSTESVLGLGLTIVMIAFSFMIDYPNLILSLPLIVWAVSKFVKVKFEDSSYRINIWIPKLLSLFFILLPLSIFAWVNIQSYGSPYQLSGTLRSVKAIDDQGLPVDPSKLVGRVGPRFEVQDLTRKKTASGFFKTRNILNGLYVHLISPDRGVVYYAPVMLMMLPGIIWLIKKHRPEASVLLSIVFANLTLYSMWGDPWGGWAFGSRYLIPSYAILSIFLALTLAKFNKLWFVIIIMVLGVYSNGVNTLGAVTSNKNPPQNEVLALESVSRKVEKYTYARNWDYLTSNGSKSFVWKSYLRNHLQAKDYYFILFGYISFVMTSLTLINYLHIRNSSNKHVE